MSSGREVSVILPDQYTSSRREGSIASRAGANSTRRSVPTRRPAPLSTRPKATAASSMDGTWISPSGIAPRPAQPTDERGEAGIGGPLLVLTVLEDGAQGRLDELLVELSRAEGDERLGPVEGLGHAGWFVEVHRAHLLRRRGNLAGQPLLGVGDPEAYDLDLPLEAGVFDVVVEAAALEGVVDLTGAVGGQDGHGRTFGHDGAQLGDRDGEVGEDLEEKCLELVVGAVHLVYEQHGRHRTAMLKRLQQRTAGKELAVVEVALDAFPVFAPKGFGGADVEELARVIPLVDGLIDVYALVALQADEGRLEDAGENLGDLGLADPCFAFEEQRPSELEGEEDRGREPFVRQVIVLSQPHSQLPEMRNAGGQGPPASTGRKVQRLSASSTARLLRTRARWRLYSSEAAMSDEGLVPSSAELVASATEEGSAPESAFSAAVALKGVEPILVSPMRAEPIEPFDRSTTAATPTTAQSWARRVNFFLKHPALFSFGPPFSL